MLIAVMALSTNHKALRESPANLLFLASSVNQRELGWRSMVNQQSDQETPWPFTTGENPSVILPAEIYKERDKLGPSHVYPIATKLFQQGSKARDVYFIESGLVKLIHYEQEGQEMIVDLRYPGWMLGSSSVVIQQPLLVTAVTLTECCLRRLPAETFLHLLNTDARLSWQLHLTHSHEISEYTTRLTQLGCFSARLRLEQLLCRLFSVLQRSDQSNKDWVQLPLKNWELAELIAITPEHLSRILKQMQREGTIRRQKGGMIISQRFIPKL